MSGTTYTPSLRLAQMTPGDPAVRNAWGTVWDATVAAVESAITGATPIDLTGVTTLTLTANNNAPDQSRQALLSFTGTLSANCVVILPAVSKIGWAVNNTAGGFKVTLQTTNAGPSSGKLALPSGGAFYFYSSDGTNVIEPAFGFGAGSFSGAVAVGGNLSISGQVNSAGLITTSSTLSAAGEIQGNAGNQFRAVTGNYGVILRNDGTNAYLLQTAANQPLGTFNGFRPLFWNLSSGQVTIDGTGLGAFTGGNLDVAGTLTIPQSTNALKAAAGNASVTMSSNGMTLQMSNNGNADFAYFDDVANFSWRSGASTPMFLTLGGNLTITGSLTQGSDRRLKRKIKRITPDIGFGWLFRAKPVQYEMGGAPSAGFLAQDEVLDGWNAGIALAENPKMKGGKNDPQGKQYVMDYGARVALLTAAVQHLAKRLAALETRLARWR